MYCVDLWPRPHPVRADQLSRFNIGTHKEAAPDFSDGSFDLGTVTCSCIHRVINAVHPPSRRPAFGGKRSPAIPCRQTATATVFRGATPLLIADGPAGHHLNRRSPRRRSRVNQVSVQKSMCGVLQYTQSPLTNFFTALIRSVQYPNGVDRGALQLQRNGGTDLGNGVLGACCSPARIVRSASATNGPSKCVQCSRTSSTLSIPISVPILTHHGVADRRARIE